jgi:hypothetical protein
VLSTPSHTSQTHQDDSSEPLCTKRLEEKHNLVDGLNFPCCCTPLEESCEKQMKVQNPLDLRIHLFHQLLGIKHEMAKHEGEQRKPLKPYYK